MKNKKIFLKTLILLILMIVFTQKIEASNYNGAGSNAGPGTNKGDCKVSKETTLCQYGNGPSKYMGVKISLVYVDNGNISSVKDINGNKIGSKYLTNYKSIADKYDNWKYNTTIIKGQYSDISKNLAQYFGATTNGCSGITDKDKFEKNFKSVFGISIDSVDFENIGENQEALCSNEKQNINGYRIILEPVISFKNKYDVFYYYTPKEISKKMANEGVALTTMNSSDGITPYSDIKKYFYTTKNDVGIYSKSAATCEGLAPSEISKTTNGCGYNIIDITKVITPPECYEKTVKTDNGGLKCINSNQNNIETYSEVYEKQTCTKEEYDSNTNTIYGKLIKSNENCNVYCIETATASFPGNLSNPILLESVSTRGNYFTWPSRNTTGGMNMFMKVKFTCRIKKTDGKTCTNKDLEELKKSTESTLKNIKMGAALEAGTNKKIDESLKEYDTNFNFGNWNNNKFDSKGWSEEFWIEKTSYFMISENKNRLYNKISGNVFDGISTIDNDVFDRKEGVISLKAKEDTEKIYDLEIKNVELGTGNQFGKLITSYVCKYKLKDTSTCTCPPGTLKEGESLYDLLVEGKTCSELQATLCNRCECPPNSSNEYEVLYEGEDATTEKCEELQKKQCYNNYCTFNGKKIDITDCINTQMSKEDFKLTKEEATVYCEQKLCPECTDSNGVTHDLTDCLSSGKPYNLCKQTYCPRRVCVDKDCPKCSENCKWTLKEKSKTTVSYKKSCSDGDDCGYIKLSCPGGNDNMNNAESCIQNELKDKLNGKTVAEGLTSGLINSDNVRGAFNVCESIVCPYSENKIVYRQIDLNDPFPGKEHAGENTNLKFSNNNQNIKTRTPGENWNSTTVITTKILNARGAKGYELYNKDPLYIIELTPDTMKKIREYNKKHDYDDFNLICTNTNKSASCISYFLHKQGTINNLNPSDFIKTKYGNKNSTSNCYNMKFDEASFNSCYNKNN